MRKVELNPRFNGIIEHDLLAGVSNALATQVGDAMNMSVALAKTRLRVWFGFVCFFQG